MIHWQWLLPAFTFGGWLGARSTRMYIENQLKKLALENMYKNHDD